MRSVLSLLLIASLSPALARAEVSLKNGNFFTGSKDITYTGGFDMSMERVYNSKTSFKGWFGNGWGTVYEVFLQIGGDGSVTVHEYGGGADNLFTPPAMDPAEIAAAVDRIVQAAEDQGDVTGDAAQAYRTQLLNDSSKRSSEWQKYIGKGLLQPRVLPLGTRLTSDRFSYQVIVVVRDGYRRDFENGRTEFYRRDGRLREVVDRNGNSIVLSYETPGQVRIVDNNSHAMTLFLDANSRVIRIEGTPDQTCEYRYNQRQELISAKLSNGDIYTYEYDDQGRHNLTRVNYPDKSFLQIVYYPRDLFENVKSILDRDGTRTDYAYDIDPVNKLHYTVHVAVVTPHENAKDVPISDSTYEYRNKTKADGEEYTAQMITTLDGDVTDTVYEENGLPLKITHNGEATTFSYDVHGHVTRKETDTEITELEYDENVGKVSMVRHISKDNPRHPTVDRFTYDSRGNLVTASDDTRTVHLTYDDLGRIDHMDCQNGEAVAFEYNSNGKPVKITVRSHKDLSGATVPERSINVTYNPDGEIKKVDSAQGRQAAIAVTTAFQELLDLIRPAGVSLTF
jgi:YD repeat-containing protein